MSEFIESVYSKILRVSNEIRNTPPSGPTFEDWKQARKEELSPFLESKGAKPEIEEVDW